MSQCHPLGAKAQAEAQIASVRILFQIFGDAFLLWQFLNMSGPVQICCVLFGYGEMLSEAFGTLVEGFCRSCVYWWCVDHIEKFVMFGGKLLWEEALERTASCGMGTATEKNVTTPLPETRIGLSSSQNLQSKVPELTKS